MTEQEDISQYRIAYQTGFCLMKSGNFETALFYFNSIESAFPGNLLYEIARCKYELGYIEEALPMINQAIEADKYNCCTFRNTNLRAEIYFAENDYASALIDYTELINIISTNCEYYRLRAICYDKLGLTEEAEKDREKTVILGCSSDNDQSNPEQNNN